MPFPGLVRSERIRFGAGWVGSDLDRGEPKHLVRGEPGNLVRREFGSGQIRFGAIGSGQLFLVRGGPRIWPGATLFGSGRIWFGANLVRGKFIWFGAGPTTWFGANLLRGEFGSGQIYLVRGEPRIWFGVDFVRGKFICFGAGREFGSG